MIYPDWSGLYDYPFTKVVSKQSSYFTAHVFHFHGTDKIGTPEQIEVLCGRVDPGAILDLRIYDVGNNALIAEITGEAADFPTECDLGTLSNVPEGPGIWEVQIRNSGVGNKEVAVASLVMRF